MIRLSLIPNVAIALLVGLLMTGVARAADTPMTLPGAKLISSDEVVKAQSSGALVIDARIASEYADGHIKGAVNIPYREKSDKAVSFDPRQDEFNLAKLPADKGAAIILYCNGPECWKSFKASTAAIKDGYTNINWYRDGFPSWKSKGLPVE
jgi:rhodanese-related sulfurtransferase